MDDRPPRSSDVVLARKTHRKSRLGCVECKRRRVKCDEAKPACTNCRRRSTECSFLRGDKTPQPLSRSSPDLSITTTSHLRIIDQHPFPPINVASANGTYAPAPHIVDHVSHSALHEDQLTQSTSPQNADIRAMGEPPAFDAFDLELWHHWLTVVCYAFADNLDGLPMWRDNIPRISFAHNYVAQFILALSALHLARVDAARSTQCLTKSQALQSTAISGMLQAISHGGDPAALWAASSLLMFCSFAKGPSRGQYLLYAEDAEPEWLDMLFAVKPALTHNPDALNSLLPDTRKHHGLDRGIDPEDLIPGVRQAFTDLRSSIDAFRAEDSSFDKYILPLEELQSCFTDVFERSDSLPGERIGGREGVRVNSHQIFEWLYRVSRDYLVSLQERRPMALVILAHYLVLMAQLKDAWYLEGWAPHIMDAIKRHMHPAYQRWLEWPQTRLEQSSVERG